MGKIERHESIREEKMMVFESEREVIKFVQENLVQQVDIKFTNLFGGLHHITIPVSRFENAFKEGIGVDGSSIPGFASAESSDMVLIPDIATGFMDPFFEVKTLSFIGGLYNSIDRQPHPHDPRYIARKAEVLLSKKDYANLSLWGPEYEFYVFNRVDFKNSENIAFYEVDSEEAHWNSLSEDDQNDGYLIKRGKGYHAAPPRDHLFNFRSRLAVMLENIGINVKYHHHENGGAGQVEVEVQLGELLKSADIGQLVKYFAKMIAFEDGLTVTFMPKPLFNEAGSGIHFHQVLFKDNEPVFFNKDSSGFEFTQIALSYIAGLLSHTPSLIAITNPSTNSYKRLFSGFEAPNRAFYSLSNRKAAIRIPAYVENPMEKRIEFRPPDATGNIYISMAAMLLAGIDGIEKKMDPVALKLDKSETGTPLPDSLESALKNLQIDNEYLKKDKVFDEKFFQGWILEKAKEAENVNSRTHPYEVELYYDC